MESGWSIHEQPYSFKEYQKLYGKNVNKVIRKDLRFVCYREWEKDAPNNQEGLSQDDCVHYQIDFGFKEAYNYLIKTIEKTGFNLDVEIQSRLSKNGVDGYWIFEKYALCLNIKNLTTNKELSLSKTSDIYELCFKMTSKPTFLGLMLKFAKGSIKDPYFSFLYLEGKEAL